VREQQSSSGANALDDEGCNDEGESGEEEEGSSDGAHGANVKLVAAVHPN